ncbi:hypothetical protein NQ315_010563 [Exocentrus adspersus]|uniref:Kazal-like domain-containing protein n=1 Tax=Exocentrus adspersus TaxID=1586481 RepID=A0AAV8W581_9CUCU|nr:hypothetical protein NQ315_010563 [Exocentrus adspersus]
MKHRVGIIVLLILSLTFIYAAPYHSAMPACLTEECDLDSGPVCAIDASGLPRTFDNRCMAMLAFCRFGSYFAEVKPGEC